jgi:hypothetical protein
LNRYPQTAEEEVCRSCPLQPTKPDATPDELEPYVAAALTLSSLFRSGARFSYPDALSAVDWACLNGLTAGRERADGMKAERDRQQRRLEEKKRRLGRE